MADQRAALKAAGVPVDGYYPPVYTDLMKDTRSNKPLVRRTEAIRSLRAEDGDEIVVYDAATLGRNHEEISEAIAAIGATGCRIIICKPELRVFLWGDASDMFAVAAEGASILRSEKHRTAGNKTGAAPKLVGSVLEAARALWPNPDLTAKQVTEKVFDATGVMVSTRLLFAKLGHKSIAELRLLRPVMPAPSKPKRKTKPKRRKLARKPSK